MRDPEAIRCEVGNNPGAQLYSPVYEVWRVFPARTRKDDATLDLFLDHLERWIPNLRRYARALTRDREQADDLVQDCLERALSRRHLWNEGGNTRAWLFTIMHNIHANDTRRNSSRPATVPIEEDAGHHARPPAQGARIAGLEMAAALEELPDEQRRVILLVALEGMSYGEVSETLGVAQGTVMSRLSRGRERLRRLMEDGAPGLRIVK